MILTSCLCVGYCVHFAVVPSGPRTWEPSNGAVPTMLRTCGWKEKFCSKVSLLSNCRLDAAANPDETFLEPPLSSPLETADVFPVSSDWIA